MYDIIGDVHGHAQTLKNLLLQLGYKKTNGGYTHPSRKAIFTGDFINRGPQIRKTVRMIRTMVENGDAFAILGNHEINAVIAELKDKNGNPLVHPPLKNFISNLKTQKAFAKDQEEWKSHLKWFRSLPLFLEKDGIRVIHACWAGPSVDYLKSRLPGGKIKKKEFRKIYKKTASKLAQHVGLITKGKQFQLPGDLRIVNNKGVAPRSFRIRWWEQPGGKTFEELSFESKYQLPAYDVPEQILPACYPYPPDAPIVFFGHYCRFEGPHIIRPNVCCVDSCVAKSRLLTAYRWEGEVILDPGHLIRSE